jgi:hypothetical protein
MIPDPNADELADLDARIREVCEQDDRYRAEREWEAERRAAEAPPAQKDEPTGLVYKDYDNNAPAAVPVSGDPALDQAFSTYTQVVGEFVGEQCAQARDEAQAAVAPLQKQITKLREELCELRGFANAVRGISGPERWFKLRGDYREGQIYNRLDIVSRDGAWWVAKCDDAGACPGRDWMRGPIGEPGLCGERGLKGSRGAPGRDAPRFVSWDLDRANYRAVAKMSDGSTITLELRGLFEQYDSEKERGT